MKHSKADQLFYCFDILLLLLLGIVFFYPLYFILISSISNPSAVATGNVTIVPKGVSFEAYRIVFNDPRIFTGYRNSIFYTLFGTALNVTLTVLCGYALSRKDFFLRRFMISFLLFTMFFSGGLIPTFLLVKSLNLYNRPILMIILGAASVWNIMIARTWYATSLPEELKDAALVDGCSTGSFFVRIALPLSGSLIAVLALFYAVEHWNSYFQAMIYLSKYDYFPLQIILRDILLSNQFSAAMTDSIDYEVSGELMRYKELIKYAVVVVASIPMLIAYPFVQKYFVTGVMMGSLKG